MAQTRFTSNIRFIFRTLPLGLALLAISLSLTACGSFFVCEGKSDCSTSGTTTSTGNYAYISNSASGNTYLDGFQISGGSLVSATGSPYSLGYVPGSMAITPSNAYLYIAALTSATPGIYGYSIGTGGALTILNSGNELEAENSAAIAISPDGQWLFSLNTNGITMEEYKIASTTGLLTYVTNYPISNSNANLTVTPESIAIAPSAEFIVVSLGTAGFETFTFNTSTGGASSGPVNQTYSSTTGIGFYGLAIDSNNNLYAAATNALYVYSVTSAGIPTQTSATATGTGPLSVALDGTSYVFTGYENSSSAPVIATLAISTSNPLTGTTNVAPTTVGALAVDKTNTYVVASGYNASSGIQLFSIGSGTLTSISSAASGTTTSIPSVIAMTH